MKIWCQLPVKLPKSDPHFKDHYDFLMKHFERVKRKDTEVVIKDVSTPAKWTGEWQRYTGLRFFNDMELFKCVLNAEKEGFDGLIVSCFLDPALYEVRQLLNIPVTGLGESSMRLASQMGAKFAIITKDPYYEPVLEEHILKYGMESKVIKRNPVRALTLPKKEIAAAEEKLFKGITDGAAPLIDNFKEVAKGCLDDGAEVLIMGCGLLSPVLMNTGLTEIDGAPLVEPQHAALKLNELLVDLYKAKLPFVSRKSTYLGVSKDDIAAVLASRG